MIYYDFVPGTLVGDVLIAATSKGLCAVLFGAKTRDALETNLARMFPRVSLERSRSRLASHRREIEEYFAGKRKRFSTPVDLSAVRSPFRRRVLRTLKSIPFGKVTSYGELAARCGSPGAARAVGTAMATNPLALVIPCHRVIAASGGLGGYSGGLSKKMRLLIHEGVEPTRSSLLKASVR